ncbi:iron complex transport system substrate-binding protein [Chryseolinea serpens]|uniref:Iron complex transport system substrate-binding protein n=1 Tax=Chryseolinea serpens TaxID=947013 RepID=A0A1M5NHS3_9BACT|nr:ABC transporter substrate-binding protein [Chryseolinea serpens]SHG89126.1 iron complex transport system substrate-binding protein [Chryseolinea serpens]
MRSTFIFLPFLLLAACSTRKTEAPPPPASTSSATALLYAEGFTVRYEGNVKHVEVTQPFQGATSGYKYLLVPRDENIPAHADDEKVIRIPLQSIVCTATTHIPLLDYLNESDKLTGFPTTDYISSEKMRQRIDAGKIQELGVDQGMNLERLAVLKPDMVMGYSMNSDYGQFKKMEELGVPVVLNAEYLERHPLGRAEWIKFMALFFNKEKLADSVFRSIEKSYLDTKAMADSAKSRPTVLSGVVYSDAWFLPGGKNYASTILNDAGCNYLWKDDPSSGWLQLSFESVYEKAYDADLWIGLGSYTSLREIAAADRRYAKFKSFVQKKVYNYDARKGAKGGSEYLELGYLRPDIILQDLVKIAHPELQPWYALFFYRALE